MYPIICRWSFAILSENLGIEIKKIQVDLLVDYGRVVWTRLSLGQPVESHSSLGRVQNVRYFRRYTTAAWNFVLCSSRKLKPYPINFFVSYWNFFWFFFPIVSEKSPTPVRKSASTRRNGPAVNSLNAKVHNTNATTTTKGTLTVYLIKFIVRTFVYWSKVTRRVKERKRSLRTEEKEKKKGSEVIAHEAWKVARRDETLQNRLRFIRFAHRTLLYACEFGTAGTWATLARCNEFLIHRRVARQVLLVTQWQKFYSLCGYYR